MKKSSKLIALSAAVLLMGALAVPALAADSETAAGTLTEAQSERLELRRAALQERVDAGTLTQEQADAVLQLMEQNMADCTLGGVCDGTGRENRGRSAGRGFGGGGCGANGSCYLD